MKMIAVWDIIPYSLVEIDRLSEVRTASIIRAIALMMEARCQIADGKTEDSDLKTITYLKSSISFFVNVILTFVIITKYSNDATFAKDLLSVFRLISYCITVTVY
jgi:hypothetical protein